MIVALWFALGMMVLSGQPANRLSSGAVDFRIIVDPTLFIILFLVYLVLHYLRDVLLLQAGVPFSSVCGGGFYFAVRRSRAGSVDLHPSYARDAA
jgi:Cu/Ag efflux pump CusA